MVHCFTVNGRRLALDVESGSIHMLDETAYEILKITQNLLHIPAAEGLLQKAKEIYLSQNAANAQAAFLPDSDLNETLSEIKSLIEAKLLFTPEGKQKAYLQSRRPVVKALCLHIAHACNLRCAYCFAGQGAYGGERGLMSAGTGKKAIDFLINSSGARRHLEVDFFGGEPMLNFNAVKEIVAYGREREKEAGKEFRFTLTTNGTLLTEADYAFINEQMDNVVLSIDGRREVHDRMRKNADSDIGSYESILPKLLQMANSRKNLKHYVRGTYTRYNLDFSKDVLHLADAGFKNISVEPAVAPPTEGYALTPEDVPALCAEYEKLAAEMLEREKRGRAFRFFHFEIDPEAGPCAIKRATGCGAGTEYLAVTPEGSLYPCHQFVSESAFRVGSLDEGITAPEVAGRFAGCNVFAKPECASCFAKYYCGGGCAANAYHTRGDTLTPDEIGCALQRKRTECALWLYSERKML
ncbi:MAG: thioether cross-link-forming SCIFF peptide maturase [Clostridiales bacterium]|jgi:uncharacterized protein|nr:thioether cross-link-forming SCIFF peptide maturase [Clostridiales bacterium]